MDKKNSLIVYFINLSFFLYFLLLIVERTLSVILSIVNGVNLFANAFNGYTYCLVFISVGAFIAYLSLRCRENIKGLFRVNGEVPQFRDLCIASGILLLSGMVHTEYTIPGIQFASYGILIAGILLRVILDLGKGNKAIRILSFLYLVSFSMAIPVMYRSAIELSILFHILEAMASVVLVGVFTFLMVLLFEGFEDLFFLWPIVIAAIFDATLIGLRWQEEINWFVLIFLGLSVVLYIAGVIYKLVRKPSSNNQ